MMCFRDKTFCPFNRCEDFKICKDAYTKEVKEAAEKWWGNKNAPVALWAEHPKCYQGRTRKKQA